MAKNIEDIVRKQIDNLSRASESIKSGVMSVTVAPGKIAAANKERYLAGVTKSVDKWVDNVGSVSLPDWQSSMVDKGIPRIAEGIRQAEPKIRDFHTQLQSYQSSYLPKLNTMKVLSIGDAIAKASANIEAMSKFRFRRK